MLSLFTDMGFALVKVQAKTFNSSLVDSKIAELNNFIRVST